MALRKRKIAAFLPLIFLLAAFPACEAEAPSEEAYKDWGEVELSEETVKRGEEERILHESSRTEEEKQDEALSWYVEKLEAAREEEQRLSEQLKAIEEIEGLSELSGELRAKYTALEVETRDAIAVCREEQRQWEAEKERIEATRQPPPDWPPPED
jgi:hypothetical protein